MGINFSPQTTETLIDVYEARITALLLKIGMLESQLKLEEINTKNR